MGRRQVAHGDLPLGEPRARRLERRDVSACPERRRRAVIYFSRSHLRRARQFPGGSMKARFVVAATFAVASFVAVAVSAQTPAPPMQSILAGKKLTPPVKGQADVDFTQPVTKKVGGDVVTTIKVKNTSAAPIARLRIIETWFDKNNATVPGGEG